MILYIYHNTIYRHVLRRGSTAVGRPSASPAYIVMADIVIANLGLQSVGLAGLHHRSLLLLARTRLHEVFF